MVCRASAAETGQLISALSNCSVYRRAPRATLVSKSAQTASCNHSMASSFEKRVRSEGRSQRACSALDPKTGVQALEQRRLAVHKNDPQSALGSPKRSSRYFLAQL